MEHIHNFKEKNNNNNFFYKTKEFVCSCGEEKITRKVNLHIYIIVLFGLLVTTYGPLIVNFLKK